MAPSTARASSIAQQDSSTTSSGAVDEKGIGNDLQFATGFPKPVSEVNRKPFTSTESADEVTERAIFEDLLLVENHLQKADPDDDLQSNHAVADEHDQHESKNAALALVLGEAPNWWLL